MINNILSEVILQLAKTSLKLSQIVCPNNIPTWWQEMFDECLFIEHDLHQLFWALSVLKEAVILRFNVTDYV